jgi:hypothetical protein
VVCFVRISRIAGADDIQSMSTAERDFLVIDRSWDLGRVRIAD